MTTTPNIQIAKPAHLLGDLTSENSVLGAVIQRPDALFDVTPLVKPEDFLLLRNRYVFEAMLDTQENGQIADIVNINAALSRAGKLQDVGGMQYLLNLMGACPNDRQAEDYARHVARKAYRNRLRKAATAMLMLVDDPKTTDAKLAQFVEVDLAGLTDTGEGDPEPRTLKSVVSAYFDKLEMSANLPDGLTGMATGFSDYDAITDGYQDGSQNVMAGRPGMGKTAAALNIVLNAAERGDNVYFWSGEMTEDQLAERAVASRSGVRANTLRRGLRKGGGMNAREWVRFTDTTGELSILPITIDDMSEMTIQKLVRRVKRSHRRKPLNLIVVDYIGLLSAAGKFTDREKEIAYISRRLKILAKTLKIRTLVLAQLNRGLESRADKRPTLADLRDSGSLEQDADTVTFLYRDVVYNKNTENPNAAEWIVSKNRHGDTGTAMLVFEGSHTAFHNVKTHTETGK